jgi:two-component system C4-dicarboxylate transport sensor histidine kinase DctB
MWLGTGGLVLGVLLMAAFVQPIAGWFQLRFWPALACFVPCLLLGLIAGHLEERGRLSLQAYGALVLIGNAYLQFFFGALISFSSPPGSFALASLLVLTLAFHGYMTRTSTRFPYTLIGAAIAIAGALALAPSADNVTVFAFVAPTSLMVCLLTGSAGLREHRDRREREQLRQAIYYRALNEKADETNRMSERVVDLLRYNHDAGNTLSSVFLNAQFLDERLRQLSPVGVGATEVDAPMTRLLDQLQRLKDLISGANRIADALPAMEAVPVCAIADQAIVECRATFPNVIVTLQAASSAEPHVLVHDGEMGLRRILQNVLFNACEGDGASAAKHVRLEITCGEGWVQLRCSDDGPGFPAAQLEQRVMPFITTKANGHGLGLFNVGHLVEASGGSLTRNNGKERGAVIEIRLGLRLLGGLATDSVESASEREEAGAASSEPCVTTVALAREELPPV